MRTTIAILLVACCLLGWWTLGPDTTPPPPPAPNSERDETQVVAAVSPGTSTGIVETSANRDDVVSVNELHNSLAAELPDDIKWVDVRVVTRDTGEPVANADVVWINQLTHKLVSKLPPHLRPDYREQDRLVTTYGWRTRSDAHGMIRVAPGKSHAEVIAVKDGLYGRGVFTYEPAPRDGHKLEIEPDVTLRVRVRTPDDMPARGVPITTTNQDPKRPTQRTYWWWNHANIETDKNGIATFPHMQLQQRTGSRHQETPVAQWLVHVRSPGITVEPVTVDAQAPPTEPVEIVLPATGHLRVRVMSGNLALAHRQIMVWQVPAKGSKRPSYMSMNQSIQKITDEDGWIEHRHVGLHTTFYVGNYTWKAEVAGPTQAGTTSTATVNIDEHAVVLAGRILTRKDGPLASESCTLKFHNDKQVTDQAMVFTKPDGSFLHIMSPGQKDKPRDRIRIEFRWDPQDHEGETVELPARVLHVGRTELGDVQLQGSQLIVAGQIVADCKVEGRCNVQIQKMRPPGKDGKPRWNGLHRIAVKVDDKLHFAAYGSIEHGRYRLQTWSDEFAPADPVEFTVGASNVLIERQCGNALTLRCLLPGALTGERISAQLFKAGETKKLRDARRHQTEPGVADYTWKGLASGTYAIEIRPSGWGRTEPLHRIDGIQLPLNGERKASMPDLDLRDMITTVELDIAFADGQENSAFVFVMPQQSDLWDAIEVQNGKTKVPIATGSQELFIAAWQHEPVTVQTNAGQASATLQPRASTVVQVTGLESISSDYRMTLYATPTVKPAKDPRRFRAGWGNNDLSILLRGTDTSERLKNGKGTLVLGDGSHRLELRLRNNKTRRSTRLKGLSPNEIVSGNAYQVQVDATELAAAIAETSKPREKKNK